MENDQDAQSASTFSIVSKDTTEVIEIDLETVTLKANGEADQQIRSFELQSGDVKVQVCTLGASITRYFVRDPNAETHDDIVLGYKDIESMNSSKNPEYFGSIVGRVANRIKNGTFHLNGKSYDLEINNPPNHLHGGSGGFHQRIWTVEHIGVIDNQGTRIPFVRFSLDSIDGDQGFPGHIKVTATYSLRPSISQTGTTLRLEMKAESLEVGGLETPVNLAQHTYFNLAPSIDRSAGILDHSLLLESNAYTPTDSVSIPTRQVVALSDHPFMDLATKRRHLKDVINCYGIEVMGYNRDIVDSDLSCRTPETPYGIDHNYVVREQLFTPLRKVATLQYKTRTLTVHSSAPGVQVYTGNYLGERNETFSRHKESYKRWAGICLETQHFPDSIFSSTTTEMVSIEFSKGKCPILTLEHPEYEHIVEYTIDHNNGPDGSDTTGRKFDSIESMWDAQDISTWYCQSSDFYEDNCPTTVDGVLGNLGWLSDDDLQGSRHFIDQLQIQQVLKDGVACECGAGIGRVTKGLLLDLCRRCDMVESSSRLLSAAPDYIGDESYRCRFFCSELQMWQPTQPYGKHFHYDT